MRITNREMLVYSPSSVVADNRKLLSSLVMEDAADSLFGSVSSIPEREANHLTSQSKRRRSEGALDSL